METFVQSVFNAIDGVQGKTLVVGGDGRFFNAEAIQTILRIAAANGAARAIVGQNGLLSTPAASNLIRKRKANGGLILSASHNPGGIDEDFGLKYNISNGGPAPESVTAAIFEETSKIAEYHTLETDDLDLERLGEQSLGSMTVELVDPVKDYAELMRQLFDFGKIRDLIAGGFTLRFDAMHAVTGPYAKAILEDELGAPAGSVINAVPSVDFGKGHPDPNPIWAKPLVDLVMSEHGPDFAAASDGDGDRNMILAKVSTSRRPTVWPFWQPTHNVRRVMPPDLQELHDPCRRVRPVTGLRKNLASVAMKRPRDGNSSAICSMADGSHYAVKKAQAPVRTMFGKRMVFGLFCFGSTYWRNVPFPSVIFLKIIGQLMAGTTIRVTTTRLSVQTPHRR